MGGWIFGVPDQANFAKKDIVILVVGDFDNAAYAFHIMQWQNLAATKSSHAIQADLLEYLEIYVCTILPHQDLSESCQLCAGLWH